MKVLLKIVIKWRVPTFNVKIIKPGKEGTVARVDITIIILELKKLHACNEAHCVFMMLPKRLVRL